ncbi:hypothetical protein PGTUg99_014812 [Puccinia graminis f. sp. tritici]|uniref:Uncharacterized protein n=1 Tax=Puccinia graminis f. sp. tritici TaxID=56615 RepID=A0A5B0SM51_PUCGR|nr:hypothetical protein PGTUg99_014812 [Puccinia graminis f. sp. tritici]
MKLRYRIHSSFWRPAAAAVACVAQPTAVAPLLGCHIDSSAANTPTLFIGRRLPILPNERTRQERTDPKLTPARGERSFAETNRLVVARRRHARPASSCISEGPRRTDRELHTQPPPCRLAARLPHPSAIPPPLPTPTTPGPYFACPQPAFQAF